MRNNIIKLTLCLSLLLSSGFAESNSGSENIKDLKDAVRKNEIEISDYKLRSKILSPNM